MIQSHFIWNYRAPLSIACFGFCLRPFKNNDRLFRSNTGIRIQDTLKDRGSGKLAMLVEGEAGNS